MKSPKEKEKESKASIWKSLIDFIVKGTAATHRVWYMEKYNFSPEVAASSSFQASRRKKAGQKNVGQIEEDEKTFGTRHGVSGVISSHHFAAM